MKKLLPLLAAAALVLTGCADDAAPESSGHLPRHYNTFLINTETNGTVECVFAKSGNGGGLSCNWN